MLQSPVPPWCEMPRCRLVRRNRRPMLDTRRNGASGSGVSNTSATSDGVRRDQVSFGSSIGQPTGHDSDPRTDEYDWDYGPVQSPAEQPRTQLPVQLMPDPTQQYQSENYANQYTHTPVPATLDTITQSFGNVSLGSPKGWYGQPSYQAGRQNHIQTRDFTTNKEKFDRSK